MFQAHVAQEIVRRDAHRHGQLGLVMQAVIAYGAQLRE